jgi:hypothetical protein
VGTIKKEQRNSMIRHIAEPGGHRGIIEDHIEKKGQEKEPDPSLAPTSARLSLSLRPDPDELF